MSYKGYYLSFKIKTPIIVGYNDSMGFERTRYYIPPINMMGAFAASLSRNSSASTGHMRRLDEFFKFSTFFLSDDGVNAFYPRLTPEGTLLYGKKGLSLLDFSGRFVSSKAGMQYGLPRNLSESEFLMPKDGVKGNDNYLVGYVFVKNGAEMEGFRSWLLALKQLWVGEEINYGLGRIVLEELREVGSAKGEDFLFSIDGIRFLLERDEVIISYEVPSSLLSHAFIDNAEGKIVNIYGVKEPIRGRVDHLGGHVHFGQEEAYWVPGTLIYPHGNSAEFRIGHNGIWYLV
ncbi:MAG TPA: hypothetical protein DEA47_04545 [Peptococcaceae bacterium]|nr:MAG: Uncharacterized protein XD50_1591 [Clostridia bacterium 41_269]HBT20615.1 hypothetical protein [Peptococcaceae bacterium]